MLVEIKIDTGMHSSGNQDRHGSRVGRIKEQIIISNSLSLVPSLPDLCSKHERKKIKIKIGETGDETKIL